jgi:hypothetical protein
MIATGQGYWKSHLLAYAFSTAFLFGLAAVLNAAAPEFFFNYPRTIQITLIDPTIDALVWAVSATCFSALVILPLKRQRLRLIQITIALLVMVLSATLLFSSEKNLPHSTTSYVLFVSLVGELASLSPWRTNFHEQPRISSTLVAIYFLAYFAIIEISSGVHWVVRSFGSATQIGSFDAAIELNFSYTPYALIPWLYVAFLFSWAWVPLVWKLVCTKRTMHKTLVGSSDESFSLSADPVTKTKLSILLDPRLFLVLSVAVFVGYYPYFQNPPWLVGTDAYWRYLDPLIMMNGKGVFGGFIAALGEWHPVPLMVLYTAQLVFHTTAFAVVKYSPVFLVLGLGCFTWLFLARKKNLNFGLIAFLLSALSVTTMVGLYASIVANWMALVCWMLFLAYVGFRGDEKFRAHDFLILLVMSTLILLLHPWTWGLFAAAIVLAIAITLLEGEHRLRQSALVLLSIIVADTALAFLALMLLPGSQGSSEVNAVELYLYAVRNPSTTTYFWPAVKRLTEIWSPFFSPVYLAASILGVFGLLASNLAPWRRNLVFSWLIVSAIGSILVAPIGFDPAHPTLTESQLWRLFFLTPFYLTAPFGIAWLGKLPSNLRLFRSGKPDTKGRAESHRLLWLGSLFILGILLALLPAWIRGALLIVALPLSTAMILLRCEGAEAQLLSDVIIVTFVLVAFNSAVRSLSQLLIDPHSAFRSS